MSAARYLMKCRGNCSIEVACVKCGRNIVAIVDEDRVVVLENRRENDSNEKAGQVKISVSKPRKPQKPEEMKKASNY